MSSPVVSPNVGYRTKTIPLPSHLSENESVIFTEVITFLKPRLPLAIVHYSVNGVPQPSALRIDFDKQVFLDHLTDPDLDAKVSPKARNIVTHLAELHTQRLAALQF